MAWVDPNKTRVDVCTILGLPVAAPRWVEWVQRGMNNVETYGGERATGLVESWIEGYYTAETALNTGADQAGLIKADVLEWEPGYRQSGYQNEMKRFQGLILRTLFTEPERTQIMREGIGLKSGIALR